MANEAIALISLGCAKNLVNSEQMLCLLSDAGYRLVSEPAEADAVVVNTCGFIDAAKSEAIDTILEMADLRAETGKPGRIIVAGCLSQRYREEIKTELPEVDALVGVGSFAEIVAVVGETLAGRRPERSLCARSARVRRAQRQPGSNCASPGCGAEAAARRSARLHQQG